MYTLGNLGYPNQVTYNEVEFSPNCLKMHIKSKCIKIHLETTNSEKHCLGDTPETNNLWDTRQKCHNLGVEMVKGPI